MPTPVSHPAHGGERRGARLWRAGQPGVSRGQKRTACGNRARAARQYLESVGLRNVVGKAAAKSAGGQGDSSETAPLM